MAETMLRVVLIVLGVFGAIPCYRDAYCEHPTEIATGPVLCAILCTFAFAVGVVGFHP